MTEKPSKIVKRTEYSKKTQDITGIERPGKSNPFNDELARIHKEVEKNLKNINSLYLIPPIDNTGELAKEYLYKYWKALEKIEAYLRGLNIACVGNLSEEQKANIRYEIAEEIFGKDIASKIPNLPLNEGNLRKLLFEPKQLNNRLGDYGAYLINLIEMTNISLVLLLSLNLPSATARWLCGVASVAAGFMVNQCIVTPVATWKNHLEQSRKQQLRPGKFGLINFKPKVAISNIIGAAIFMITSSFTQYTIPLSKTMDSGLPLRTAQNMISKGWKKTSSLKLETKTGNDQVANAIVSNTTGTNTATPVENQTQEDTIEAGINQTLVYQIQQQIEYIKSNNESYQKAKKILDGFVKRIEESKQEVARINEILRNRNTTLSDYEKKQYEKLRANSLTKYTENPNNPEYTLLDNLRTADKQLKQAENNLGPDYTKLKEQLSIAKTLTLAKATSKIKEYATKIKEPQNETGMVKIIQELEKYKAVIERIIPQEDVALYNRILDGTTSPEEVFLMAEEEHERSGGINYYFYAFIFFEVLLFAGTAINNAKPENRLQKQIEWETVLRIMRAMPSDIFASLASLKNRHVEIPESEKIEDENWIKKMDEKMGKGGRLTTLEFNKYDRLREKYSSIPTTQMDPVVMAVLEQTTQPIIGEIKKSLTKYSSLKKEQNWYKAEDFLRKLSGTMDTVNQENLFDTITQIQNGLPQIVPPPTISHGGWNLNHISKHLSAKKLSIGPMVDMCANVCTKLTSIKQKYQNMEFNNDPNKEKQNQLRIKLSELIKTIIYETINKGYNQNVILEDLLASQTNPRKDSDTIEDEIDNYLKQNPPAVKLREEYVQKISSYTAQFGKKSLKYSDLLRKFYNLHRAIVDNNFEVASFLRNGSGDIEPPYYLAFCKNIYFIEKEMIGKDLDNPYTAKQIQGAIFNTLRNFNGKSSNYSVKEGKFYKRFVEKISIIEKITEVTDLISYYREKNNGFFGFFVSKKNMEQLEQLKAKKEELEASLLGIKPNKKTKINPPTT